MYLGDEVYILSYSSYIYLHLSTFECRIRAAEVSKYVEIKIVRRADGREEKEAPESGQFDMIHDVCYRYVYDHQPLLFGGDRGTFTIKAVCYATLYR